MPTLLVLRQLLRHRLFALAFAGTLALAVGAATASLAVVKQAFVDPLPYPRGDRLVSLLTMMEGRPSAVSGHVLTELMADRPPLVGFLPIRPEGGTLTGDGMAELVMGARVTPEFFSELGASPLMGRTLRADDRDVVVVSAGFWQRALGGDPAAIGRSITLDGVSRTVVGVLEPGFLTPYFTQAEIWQPLDLAAIIAANPRARRNLTVIARIADGAEQGTVDAWLAVFTARQRAAWPEMQGQMSWTAVPLRDELIGPSAGALVGVGAAAALLVLIVIANLAGLAAARAIELRHQVAIRAALGATRRRLVGERLIECLVLSLAGAAIGLWLGQLLVALVRGFQESFLGRMVPVALDWTTGAAGVAVALVCGLVAGIVAASAGGHRFTGMLRASREGTGGQQRVRSGLVVLQVALALVLVAGAGLLVRTMTNLSAITLGFRPERLTTAMINMPGRQYLEADRQIQLERDVVAALERIPGVTAATASVGFPGWGGSGAGLTIEGRPIDAGRSEIMYLSIAPDFLEAIGIPLLAGRGIEPTDVRSGPGVVVINETMAKTYWPGANPVGARVQIGPGSDDPWITVVGVIADVRQHGVVEPVRPTAFGPTWQYSWPRRHFAVRTSGEVPTLAAEIRRAVQSVDPAIPVTAVSSVEEQVANQTARHRLVTITLAFFGVVATALSGLGLYAVVALTSRMRRREYAIRMALGARFGGVRWLVVRQALALAAGGVAVGLVLAAGGTRALAGLLHGVTPMDRPTLIVAALVVLGLSVVAAWLPARDAGRVAPAEVLRAE